MKTKIALEYFGNAANLARAIGISRMAVHQWGELVPLASAARLEKVTNGALALDIQQYAKPKTVAA
jgi:DNA-binding transcriptional regulator YdaS (Cro superfamily)